MRGLQKRWLMPAGIAAIMLLTGGCGKGTENTAETVQPVIEAEDSEDEAAGEAVEETIAEEAPAEEPIAEPEVYTEDENVYGNSIGNIYNDGGFIFNPNGIFYFYNSYADSLYLTLEKDGLSMAILDGGLFHMNFLDEKLYGTNEDGNIVVLGVNEGTTNILREGIAEDLQVVNDRFYYKDGDDNTLRTMALDGSDEIVLLDEEVWYPVVYKDLIVFQLDSDGESLYSMPLEGGEKTKLNDVESHSPIVYRDKIYYMAIENAQYSIRGMNLDGSDDTVLVQEIPHYMNLRDGVLYYVSEENPGQITCLDVTEEGSEPRAWDLTEQMATALRETYGDEAVGELEATRYLFPNFSGKYMMFMCETEIDGSDYCDEFIYDTEEDKIIVIPVFCQNLTDSFE